MDYPTYKTVGSGYCNPDILCSGDKALVHWWYYPDSYDELVPLESAPELVEPDKVANGKYSIDTCVKSSTISTWEQELCFNSRDAALELAACQFYQTK